jgi:hypothetical protein
LTQGISCGQHLDQVEAVVPEALGVGWELAGPQQAVAGPAEHQAGLDLVLLDPAGDGQDLLDPWPPDSASTR